MKKSKRFIFWLTSLSGLLFLKPAWGASSATVDIHVSINATKSLSALTTTYDFGALGLNVSSNSATALVIRNDSGAYLETYLIQGANAISDIVGTNWALAASTSTNQYKLGAQFATNRPANTEAAWDSTDYLTLGAQTCSATQFGNGILAESGQSVSPLSSSYDRNLWLRIHTPDVVTDPTRHTISLTLSVQ